MKRLLLLTLAAAIAVSVIAVIGVRSGSGGTASAQGPTIAIDLVKDGSTWCNPVDASATVEVGSAHQAAICYTPGTNVNAASDFNITATFDLSLNSCTSTGQTGKALDANPDFIGDATNPSPSWDCSGGGQNFPRCGTDATGAPAGEAFITCGSVDDPGAITGTWAMAVINWTAGATPGTDNIGFSTTALYDYSGENLIRCPSASCVGATVTKQPAPSPTPMMEQCDIGADGMLANPPALNMKVGDPPALVDITGQWTNLGAFNAGAPDATCAVGFAWGVDMATADPNVLAPVPAGLNVRFEPFGQPSGVGGGDVCLFCFGSGVGKAISECLTGPGPFDVPKPDPSLWTYTVGPCDEGDFNPAFPMSILNESCEDGVDNNQDGYCDWDGFSALCTPPTTPDPLCLNVPALGLVPLLRPVLAPQASTQGLARVVKIECVERGTYPLVVFGSSVTPFDPAHPEYGYLDPNPANDVAYTPILVTCTKGPEMVKDCDPATEGIQDSCNLWLMDPEFAGGVEAGTDPPVTLPPADANGCVLPEQGKGCLAVDVWLKSADDEDDLNDSDDLPECLGAWEHQVRYDHKIIKFVNDLNPVTVDTDGDTVADTPWLESTGRIKTCSYSVLAENWILEGCVTKDDPAVPGMQVGPCGDGIIEKMLIVPLVNDLIYRGVFRPTKMNGVVTNIVDDNCEITDIYAEPMADTLPGGLTPVCGDLHITVRMLEGDTDLDCDIDVADDQAVAFRYGASWGLQLYDQWFDLEPKFADQDIDIKDLQFVFGRNYSTCQAPIPDDQAIPLDPGQP